MSIDFTTKMRVVGVARIERAGFNLLKKKTKNNFIGIQCLL